MLGVSHYFEIQKTTIISRTGSEFIFKGLNGLTVDSIKSLEGADYCWVEEAHSVSEKSWSILIPTIRKPGSQIFVSFNPDLETDPAYQRFVITQPPRSYVCKVNYLDNPDCPQEAKDEAEYLKRVDYEAYAHVWLGQIRQHSDAVIFKDKYTIQSFDCDDMGDPIHGADWGFSVDPTTLIRCYIKDRKLYIRSEAYSVNCEVDHTPELFDKLDGVRNYTIRADNSRPEMISFIRRAGFKIQAADKWPGCIVDRISFLRNFEQIIIHPDCKHTAEEFRLYSYKTDKRTGDILPDIIDKHNHCIDAIGYAITPLIRTTERITMPTTRTARI
jgi:phage terminase large subunit